MAALEYERTLEKTPTWAVAAVCFVLLVISIFIEHVINFIGRWFKSRQKRALYEALEKIKSELMLLGFLSLLLTVLQDPISGICIPKSVAATWHPCNDDPPKTTARKLEEYSDSGFIFRRQLATKGYDKCPIKWFSAVLFLLSNAYGWHSYLWLPFISLIIILVVGTKLQVIITKLGLRIQDTGGVVMGAPLVQPGDQHFWFGRPRFLLFLIHFALFQNAFQLAFFAWSTWQFGITSCFHQTPQDTVIRLSVGVIVQVLCSYVTLPPYALVTQMGSNMKPNVFEEGVAEAVKNWHHNAKKKAKHSQQHSERTTPFSTPPHGMSPVHLLHKANNRSEVTDGDDLFPPPDASVVVDMQHWNTEGSRSPKNNVGSSERGGIRQPSTFELGRIQELPAFSFSHPEVSSPSGISSARARK